MTEKVAIATVVTTVGGCSCVNERTTNEMLAVVVLLLLICVIWQIAIVLWGCRQRRKRIELLLQRRRVDDSTI